MTTRPCARQFHVVLYIYVTMRLNTELIHQLPLKGNERLPPPPTRYWDILAKNKNSKLVFSNCIILDKILDN